MSEQGKLYYHTNNHIDDNRLVRSLFAL